MAKPMVLVSFASIQDRSWKRHGLEGLIQGDPSWQSWREMSTFQKHRFTQPSTHKAGGSGEQGLWLCKSSLQCFLHQTIK